MLSRESSTSTRTQPELSKWSSLPHDRCGNVESVFRDCVVVSFDVVKTGLLWVVLEDRKSNHDIHELGVSNTSPVLRS